MATNRTNYSKFKIESDKVDRVIDSESRARRIFGQEEKQVLENESGSAVIYGSNDNTNWEIIQQTKFKSED